MVVSHSFDALMQEVHHIMHFGIEKLRFKISRKTEQVKNEILRYLNIYTQIYLFNRSATLETSAFRESLALL